MEEALDMLLEAERLAVEGARHIEDAVAVGPARIAERHDDLTFGQDIAIEPRDALVAECHDLPLSREPELRTTFLQRRGRLVIIHPVCAPRKGFAMPDVRITTPHGAPPTPPN